MFDSELAGSYQMATVDRKPAAGRNARHGIRATRKRAARTFGPPVG
jgi:hypothetical protein